MSGWLVEEGFEEITSAVEIIMHNSLVDQWTLNFVCPEVLLFSENWISEIVPIS